MGLESTRHIEGMFPSSWVIKCGGKTHDGRCMSFLDSRKKVPAECLLQRSARRRLGDLTQPPSLLELYGFNPTMNQELVVCKMSPSKMPQKTGDCSIQQHHW